MNNSALLNLELLYAANYMGDLPKVKSILDNGLTPEVANFWGEKSGYICNRPWRYKNDEVVLDGGFYSNGVS